MENGVPVTINTDDLLVFDSAIDEEYQRLYDAGTLTAEQLDEIRCWGIQSFNYSIKSAQYNKLQLQRIFA